MINYFNFSMKKLSLAILTAGFTMTFAQKVSDYKYIVVPNSFESFKKQNYGLSNALAKSLKAKQYIVISDNRGEWSSEANSNPCHILNADIKNDSSFLRNKILVEFKDCNNKVIASQKGSSSIKEFEEGFQDALKQALMLFPAANPKEIKTENLAQELQKTSVNEVAVQKTETTAEKTVKYSNGKIVLQKIQLEDNQFILVENNNSIPFATFKATTRKDSFKVKLRSGENTFGYLENGNVIIEIPKGNDEYSKEVFSLVK